MQKFNQNIVPAGYQTSDARSFMENGCGKDACYLGVYIN